MNQHNNPAFNTLIKLSQHSVDQAQNNLGRLINERHQAGQQLAMLEGYRQDYTARLNNVGQTGMTASNYHNFSRFLATLDNAIMQQTNVMTQLDHKIQTSTKHWRHEQQRLLSYETLQTRRLQEHNAVANRREQIITDELSANIHRRSLTGQGLQ